MFLIYVPLLAAALVVAITSTLLYHQARQNRLDRECVLAITRNRRGQEFHAPAAHERQHHGAPAAQELPQHVALELAA